MKITFVLPTVNLSGGIRVAAIYSRWLMRFGHQVVAVSPPPAVLFRHRLLRPLGLGTPRVATESHFDNAGIDHRIIERSRAIEDNDVPDADVVIATWWETAEWVAALSPAKGAKVYFVQHHEVFDWLPAERSTATYRLPLRKIVVASWLQRVMNTDYGDIAVDLVPNAVDHEQFFAPKRGKRDRPTVGFLYSKAEFKGVDLTLRAIATLRLSFPALRVVSFGDQAPQGDELGDVDFHLAPDQSKLRDLYASCDVWMTASRSEGFNLPAMEAMACRTPVIATCTGWPAEAIVDGANGWCVALNDVHGLVRAAQFVLDLSDADWRAMSTHAFDTVRGSSWEASARLFEASLIATSAQSKTNATSRS